MTTVAVKMPLLQELYANYKDWVSHNPDGATTLESTLKWVSWYLTGRLSSTNSTLLAELVFTLSKLLILFNDRIIYNSLVSNDESASNKNYQFKIWLTVLEYSEVFIELSMQKLYGNVGKWVAVCAVQIIKTIVRLTLLYSKERLLVDHIPIPPLDRENLNNVYVDAPIRGPSTSSCSDVVLPTGRVVRSLKNSPSVSQRDWKPLPQVIPMSYETRTRIFYSELLYILKPLVHLGSIYKYGPDTWRPFLTALSIDIAVNTILHRDRQLLRREDQSEATNRMIMLLLYLLKSPFYERHTRLRLERLLLSLSRYRLLKYVATPLREYLPYWQKTYFYMWSS